MRPVRSRPADRKSTRLNSSHLVISYAVFCLKKKKKTHTHTHTPSKRRRHTAQPLTLNRRSQSQRHVISVTQHEPCRHVSSTPCLASNTSALSSLVYQWCVADAWTSLAIALGSVIQDRLALCYVLYGRGGRMLWDFVFVVVGAASVVIFFFFFK